MTRVEAEARFAAGLGLQRVLPQLDADTVRRVGPWLLATISERLELPPAGVVADIGALLLGVPLRTGRSVPGADEELSAAVRRYEDGVLGRLAVDARLVSAGFAVAQLPEASVPVGVGILVSGVLARIGWTGGLEIEPGAVRLLTERTPQETVERAHATLRNDASVRRSLAEDYLTLARAAQRSRELVDEADLFAIENLEVLGSLTQRLAIADVVRAQEALAAGVPRRVVRRRRSEGDVLAKLEDESVYPAGGFASVSTAGSLENLVTSELIYMDPPGHREEVDLFDMRYVEGELLYYTRDEAVLVRRRREVTLALSSDLVRARVKDPGLPWQRIVLVLALVLVLVKKLVELLGEESLAIRVVFLEETPGLPTPLAAEMALAGLMLREWKDRGIVDVAPSSTDALQAALAIGARRALVELVHVRSGGAPWTPADPRMPFVDVEVRAETLDAWSARTSDILSALL